mmetsp:Transcript_16227/g.18777  ORF Transcript_16227/g.18777 Transcript_16227/m.18777 type:complete len:153 (+) Transcript_16227:81-539(+)
MTAGPTIDDDPWDDWKPTEQTALDFLLDQDADEDVEEEDDDDDEWNPVCQGAAMEGNSHEDVADDQDEEDEDSDSDWAPEVQGAANVEKSEEEALKVLLQPNFVKETASEWLHTSGIWRWLRPSCRTLPGHARASLQSDRGYRDLPVLHREL